MAKSKLPSWLKLLLRLLLSGAAIWFVFRNIDTSLVATTLRTSNPLWLFMALLLFNLSKLASASRLRILFADAGVALSAMFNLKLYYIGMFYNLFLPGGIGGDGYKVYLLRKQNHSTTKLLLAAVLLDRVAGAAILVTAALFFSLFSESLFENLPAWVFWLCAIGSVSSVPALFLLVKWVFPTFYKSVWHMFKWSWWVQGLQIASALSILQAFGVSEYLLLYVVVFLVSSLAATLPLSIGGIGLRELVFLFAARLLPIDESAAVSLALVFFVISAVSALVGVFLKLDPRNST